MAMPQPPTAGPPVRRLLLLLLLALPLLTACLSSNQESAAGTFGDTSVGCARQEQTAYHIHAHLSVFVGGTQVAVPARLGLTADCIAFLHTHDQRGIIHVEAPARHTYTLGDFFQVWGQPLSRDRLLDQPAQEGHEVIAYVDGARFDGAPESVQLRNKEQIVLEYGPPFMDPPTYTFPRGF
jgi:hypothetical protein